MFSTQGVDFVFQDADTNQDDQISLVRCEQHKTTHNSSPYPYPCAVATTQAEWKAAVEKNEMVQWLVCPELYVDKVMGETLDKLAAILSV